MRTRCPRCKRQIAGPRVVVEGWWLCSACLYEMEVDGKQAAIVESREPSDRGADIQLTLDVGNAAMSDESSLGSTHLSRS
jgi:hypothetical protein